MRSPGSHIPELDGLRGIAVLLVLVYHLDIDWHLGILHHMAEWGWVGVDIFFVLSGFLITRILLNAGERTHPLRTFYIKRALRIWPLYYVLLACTCGEALVLHKRFAWKESLVLVQNFLPQYPQLGFNQTWSLCVEEHFYLIWPLLIIFISRRLLPWTLFLVLLLEPVLRSIAIHHGVIPKLLYTSTQYRLDDIACGSLVALLSQNIGTLTGLARGLWLLPAGLAGCMITAYLSDNDVQYSASFYSFLAIASVSVLCFVLVNAGEPGAKLLRNESLRYVGKVSYALYLIHPVIIGFVRLTGLPATTSIFLVVACSFTVSALSWHFFESRVIGIAVRHMAKKESLRSE